VPFSARGGGRSPFRLIPGLRPVTNQRGVNVRLMGGGEGMGLPRAPFSLAASRWWCPDGRSPRRSTELIPAIQAFATWVGDER
jgi:hypothetical protein